MSLAVCQSDLIAWPIIRTITLRSILCSRCHRCYAVPQFQNVGGAQVPRRYDPPCMMLLRLNYVNWLMMLDKLELGVGGWFFDQKSFDVSTSRRTKIAKRTLDSGYESFHLRLSDLSLVDATLQVQLHGKPRISASSDVPTKIGQLQ